MIHRLDDKLTLLIPDRCEIHVNLPNHDIPFEKVRVLNHRNANVFLQQLHQSCFDLEREVLKNICILNSSDCFAIHTLAYLIKERTIWMIEHFSLFGVAIEIDNDESIRIQSTQVSGLVHCDWH